MKCYLAGPMSGIPQFNFPAFFEAFDALRAMDWDVIPPCDLLDADARAKAFASPDGKHTPGTRSWGDFLADDVRLVADGELDAIVCLPGWERSRGARLETFVARLCDVEVLAYQGPDQPPVPIDDNTVRAAHARDGRALPVPVSCVTTVVEPGSVLMGADLVEQRQTDGASGGQKGQKIIQAGALDPLALMAVAEVAGHGAEKYARLNFARGFDWSLAYDALQRHSMHFWNGDDLDPEWGLPHMAHAAWQCLCLLTFQLRGRGTDDRLHRIINDTESGS